MSFRRVKFVVLLLALGLALGIVNCAVKVSKTTCPVITNAKDGSELILIPAGEFTMGSPSGEGDDDEHPRHQVYLSAYYIGKYEVTNKQFARFVNETGYKAGGDWNICSNSSTADHPVDCVTWNDAAAYCKWAGLRLPTEAEWEKAARGTDGREYPWGNEWNTGRCNSTPSSSRTKPVGSYPDGASPYGAMDMAGNVEEWCADWYGGYSSLSQSNPRGPWIGSVRVLRGGSWKNGYSSIFRCAGRGWRDPGYRYNDRDFGFRVCRSLNTR